ncbi:MAG: tRNA uridine(34) 5-carboxymethylaminomethyl modification radical SAM/GNAT enzyme Elp3 [Patescibacteria group bacterium]|nr:tRNA uridine(34) 5-carboxymethylaminomethyl modification radical SAM/GNAT enzyme Elp3 [Patescibacteria group bacterium]
MTSHKQKIIKIIQELSQKKFQSGESFLSLFRKLTKKYQISPPSYVEILSSYKLLRSQKKIRRCLFFEEMLKKRPVRSLSGVAVVSVLTKPYPCPGQCLYCPTEKGFPKSYLAGEPAAERARLLNYNPYLQVKKRIETLQKTGHSTDKIELIIIGASWSAYPKRYQEWFIKRCFDGANFSASKKLTEAQKKNEKAKNRIIGISVETRPDLISLKEIKRMRELGITKVELGVQTLDEKILTKNQRGHGLKEIVEATKLLRNAGFKICYHLMPGLYGSTPQKDLVVFKKLFSDSNFRPDYLKIYPCVVTKGSKLYQLWKRGKYQPYDDKTLINLLVQIKKIVPPYVRIIRIFRDIPSPKIFGGTKISNLREVVKKEMAKRGLKCQCIRCREIKNLKLKIKNLILVKREYQANNGKEIFLSFEDKKNDKILAFLRLYLPQSSILNSIFKVLKKSAIIRELHSYGEIVEIGKRKKGATQHQNLGKKLVRKAEQLAKKIGAKKIAVISGVGARQYWRKIGYRLQQSYMVKNIG